MPNKFQINGILALVLAFSLDPFLYTSYFTQFIACKYDSLHEVNPTCFLFLSRLVESLVKVLDAKNLVLLKKFIMEDFVFQNVLVCAFL